jgi:BASS family bile acid:Na+ symporter
MDLLINVVLPLSLAIIMLSLGIGLTVADFGRVALRPRAFAIGALCQVVLLPLTALTVTWAFGLRGELAVGLFLLALCPGGVTSNMISRLARGDVALSVSLTAVISLLSILTVPVLAAWSVRWYMGDAAPPVTVASLALAMFLITTLPVALGVLLRHLAPRLADRVEPGLTGLATALFVLIVLAALAGNWDLFVSNLASLGPALVSLNLALMVLGLLIAGLFGLAWQARKTVSIETGIQNATLGITLAALISGQSEGFSTYALPSAVYGITMYLVALPFVAWFRSRD